VCETRVRMARKIESIAT